MCVIKKELICMRISDLLKLAFRNLMRRKARTALTIIGVVIGTISIVVMVSIGIGVNQSFDEMIMQSGSMTMIRVQKYGAVFDEEGNYVDSTEQVLDDSTVELIKGIEHVKSASSLITGMARATRMSDFTLLSNPPACVYFNLQAGMNEARKDENIAVAYASFNTFGKLKEEEGFIEVTFEFNTKYETTQVETIRVTDMFETEQVKNNRWIIIDKVIEIIPPDGVSEGMSPGVNNWENIEGNLTI